MIELLELSEVLKAVERTGTEVRYYDPDCATSNKAAGWYQLNATVDFSLFVHATTLITVIYLTLLGMKLCTWYKLAMVDQCSDRATYDKYTPQDIKDRVFNDYPEHAHHIELEAFMLQRSCLRMMLLCINKYCFE